MTFNAIFKNRYSSWEQIEKLIEQMDTTKEKGDAFEQFAFLYFTFLEIFIR